MSISLAKMHGGGRMLKGSWTSGNGALIKTGCVL